MKGAKVAIGNEKYTEWRRPRFARSIRSSRVIGNLVVSPGLGDASMTPSKIDLQRHEDVRGDVEDVSRLHLLNPSTYFRWQTDREQNKDSASVPVVVFQPLPIAAFCSRQVSSLTTTAWWGDAA
jgi:hypothetical protein